MGDKLNTYSHCNWIRGIVHRLAFEVVVLSPATLKALIKYGKLHSLLLIK